MSSTEYNSHVLSMYFSHHFFFPDVSNYFHVSGGGRYDTILELCGELCDPSKPVKDQENVVGYVTAQVQHTPKRPPIRLPEKYVSPYSASEEGREWG